MRCVRCPAWLSRRNAAAAARATAGRPARKKHWEEGGHDKLCKKIKKGGGAEQYRANKKYVEAVAVATEACAEDTKGQTCYICTEAVHWKTKEGLVRMCACRRTARFAHVSCFAEQAKILVAEGEENNLGNKAKEERWARWHMCVSASKETTVRMGVLGDVCRSAGRGQASDGLDAAAWKRFIRHKPQRGHIIRERGAVV